ncbi:MAG: alpha/beta hydrolase [Roseicyclus sp.]|nr:alpha/beta hydrolase [Roseicyclus sp.]MBO6623555.1 alpha/beta hydrolase [Roseicyclus sp.]MBO6923780.1 alpha/beta hydrolase [Roseicyclus sp.]
MSGGVRTWGQGPEPALLLHCSLAHSGAWDGVARALSDRMTMTAPDLIGHGRAPDWDRSQDLHDQTTAQVEGLLPDAPCHMIGHSFGATIALRLAERHPACVRTLTLIEPVLFAAVAQDAQDAARATSADQGEEDLPGSDADLVAAARVFLKDWGGGTAYDDLPQAQQAYMSARMPLIAASHRALHHDSAGLLPRLGQVTAPVLLMSGDASPPVVEDILDCLAAGIARSYRARIAGAGHMLPITHPGPVAAEIAAHIRRG